MSDVREMERLAALREMEVLDTPPEPVFDNLTDLAARTFNVPIALISLVDADRQWFKSAHGLDSRSTPRSMAFCHHTIESDQVMVVPNALSDPRFSDNPLVVGQPGIRFYAGAPLITSEGRRLGSICVIDTEPWPEFDAADAGRLEVIARGVVQALEMRRDARRNTKPRDRRAA